MHQYNTIGGKVSAMHGLRLLLGQHRPGSGPARPDRKCSGYGSLRADVPTAGQMLIRHRSCPLGLCGRHPHIPHFNHILHYFSSDTCVKRRRHGTLTGPFMGYSCHGQQSLNCYCTVRSLKSPVRVLVKALATEAWDTRC